MPPLLTTNALIICPHGVPASAPVLTAPISQVSGGIVRVEGDGGTITCPFCVGYLLKSMHLNAIRIQGRQAVLVTDFNQTLTGLPLTITEVNVSQDQSTPSPLPPGQASAPLAPEMLDLVKPTVTATMPVSDFTISLMSPATIVATFTLSSAFGSRWTLMRVSESTPGITEVLTNGNPSGAAVVPAGGDWPASPLVVTMTLMATYMASLGPGMHYFFMTAISKRGLNKFEKVDLKVVS